MGLLVTSERERSAARVDPVPVGEDRDAQLARPMRWSAMTVMCFDLLDSSEPDVDNVTGRRGDDAPGFASCRLASCRLRVRVEPVDVRV